MKKLTLVILFLLHVACGYAQSRWSAFAQQMAAMETYLRSLKGLYKTTQKGLNTMHNLKDGSFTLNKNYFASQYIVAPAVANNPKIRGITDLTQQIQSVFANAISWQRHEGSLSADEQNYMQSVYSHLLDDCSKDIKELQLVTSDNQSQMSDAARTAYIDKLYSAMQDRYVFSCTFADKAKQVAKSRQNTRNSNQVLQKLYEHN